MNEISYYILEKKPGSNAPYLWDSSVVVAARVDLKAEAKEDEQKTHENGILGESVRCGQYHTSQLPWYKTNEKLLRFF